MLQAVYVHSINLQMHVYFVTMMVLERLAADL